MSLLSKQYHDAVRAEAQQPKKVFPGEAQARFVVTICLSVCEKYKIVRNDRFLSFDAFFLV